MAYNYDTYNATMAELLVQTDYLTNPNWAIMLPRMIESAEQRIYRELDLLSTNTVAEADAVTGNREVSVPGNIIIVESVNVVTPAATAANSGTRNPLRRVTWEFLSYTWPTASQTGTPQWYTMKSATVMVLAPTPSAAFKVEVSGPIIPTALSSDNPTTYLTTVLPDLFIAASMLFGLGWQRDFGAMSDDPKAAVTWEAQYQTLKQSAQLDEQRRQASSTGWQAFQPTLAQPQRT